MGRVVVAGVGSAYRSDDGAGIAFATLLAEQVRGVVDVGPISEPLEVLDHLEGVEVLVLADTTRSGLPPGRVLAVLLHRHDGRYSAARGDHAAQRTSTHGIGLWRALDLASVLGMAPPLVILVGIEGEHYGMGEALSAPVAQGVRAAVPVVCELLGNSVHV